MITSKERKVLSGLGQKIDPVFQIGKNGLTETVLKEIDNALEARELIKLSVLKNNEISPRQLIDEIAEKLSAEPVSCVGQKIVLYRRSSRKDFKHIEF